jgi:hypothetical protein
MPSSTFNPCPKPIRVKKEKPIKRKVVVESNPLEEIEQQTVVEWLDAKKVFYMVNIAGCYLHPATFLKVKRMGYKRGPADIIIFDPPPAYGNQFVGVALEMKRKKGGVLSLEQKEWLEKMSQRRWLIHVSPGADDAIQFLELCGYGGKKC